MYRRHAVARARQHRARQRRAHPAETGKRESHRQHEGSHGAGLQREKLDQMRIYGAELEIIHSETGGMTARLMRDMITAARAFTERTGAFWTDQMNNTAPLSDYHRMAEEIFTQTNAAGDGIDGFVQSVAPGLRCAASARRCANGGPGSKSLPSNRRSRQFSQAARQARITLKASGWDSWCRYGRAPWPTASSAFPRKKPRPWPFA